MAMQTDNITKETESLQEALQAKEELLRVLKKATEALELIGSVTKEGMPLTVEDAKNTISKYS